MMRSLLENKRLILILAALALVALTILAIGLNEVPLREGQQFSQRLEATKRINPQEIINAWIAIPWWRQAALWVLLLILVVLVGYLLPPEVRKLLSVGLFGWRSHFESCIFEHIVI
jgi:hypothetical protein